MYIDLKKGEEIFFGWRKVEAKYAKNENRKSWPCLTKGEGQGAEDPKLPT